MQSSAEILILSGTSQPTAAFEWRQFSRKLFSAAKAALGMQMSVSLSICLSVSNAYLFVRFTSIFYNSKSDKLKLSLIINQKTSNMILKITRTLELKAFAVPGTLVLVHVPIQA